MDAPLSARPWSRRAEGAAVVAFWIALATLMVARSVARSDGAFVGAEAAETFAEMGLWALVTPVVFWLVRASAEHGGWRRLAVQLAAGVAVAFAVEAVTRGVLRPVLRGPVPADRVWTVADAFVRLRMLDEFVVYIAVLVAGTARAALFQVHERRAEAEQLRADRARLRADSAELQGQLAQARLSALQMQLHPHFLFNTLNAVSALVERDPAGVRTMIARLSSLLRRVLDTQADAVPLREEAAFLRDYLDLQRVRFQDRLTVSEAWASDTSGALVPPLVLQPLVENAVVHGVGRIEEGVGRIRVASRREGERLVMTVEDNGPGLQPAFDSPGSGGVGLANTRARLHALFGDAGTVEITSSADGVVACVVIPYREAEPDADAATRAVDRAHETRVHADA